MDKLRKRVDTDDIKEDTDVHYGPEENQDEVKRIVNKKRMAQNIFNSEI